MNKEDINTTDATDKNYHVWKQPTNFIEENWNLFNQDQRNECSRRKERLSLKFVDEHWITFNGYQKTNFIENKHVSLQVLKNDFDNLDYYNKDLAIKYYAIVELTKLSKQLKGRAVITYTKDLDECYNSISIYSISKSGDLEEKLIKHLRKDYGNGNDEDFYTIGYFEIPLDKANNLLTILPDGFGLDTQENQQAAESIGTVLNLIRLYAGISFEDFPKDKEVVIPYEDSE